MMLHELCMILWVAAWQTYASGVGFALLAVAVYLLAKGDSEEERLDTRRREGGPTYNDLAHGNKTDALMALERLDRMIIDEQDRDKRRELGELRKALERIKERTNRMLRMKKAGRGAEIEESEIEE